MTHSAELNAKPEGDLRIPKYTPIGDRVLIQPDIVAEVLKSGLILPKSVQQAKQGRVATGRVVARGPGLLCRDGSRFPMPEGFEIGSHVLYYAEGAMPVNLVEGLYVSLRDDFLIGVIEEGTYQ
jgi:co-chaperonin GroES (HSP10)